MKITALGVNSAFATGEYKDAITVESAMELFRKLIDSPDQDGSRLKALQSELQARAQRMYTPKWHSNFLIEFDMPGKKGDPPYRLLLDAGGDVRHSLKNIGLTAADIDGIYVSHPHHDHIGGLEYISLSTLFNPFYTPDKTEWLNGQFIVDKLFLENHWWSNPPASTKPDLFVHRKVLEPLRRAVGPGIDTVQGVPEVTLDTYFDVHLIGKQEDGHTETYQFQDGDGEWTIRPIFAMHVISSSEEMASYGISLEHISGHNLEHASGYNILMPTDTQHMMPPQLEGHYRRADRIYMDCETSPIASGVHPHVSVLIDKLSPEIQKKCMLYHYDQLPDVPKGMFYAILKAGDVHTYPD